MIWLFERGCDDIRIESFLDNVSHEYVLALRHPDGSHTVERFPSAATFEARLEDLESSLKVDQWRKIPAARGMKDTWQL